MPKEYDAIYENGVLRPLEPLPLADREQVRVTVSRTVLQDCIDTEYMHACAAEADESVTIEQVRHSLSKIRGSMDDVIREDRDGR